MCRFGDVGVGVVGKVSTAHSPKNDLRGATECRRRGACLGAVDNGPGRRGGSAFLLGDHGLALLRALVVLLLGGYKLGDAQCLLGFGVGLDLGEEASSLGLLLGCHAQHLDMLLGGQTAGSHARIDGGGLLVNNRLWGDGSIREQVLVRKVGAG